MSWGKRGSYAFLCLMTALGAACRDSPNEDRFARSGTLVIGTTGDADMLFPPLIASSVGRQITEQIYDYLAGIGPEMNTIGDVGFRPQLANSWQWSDDSLTIAFKIDPDARWHDGRSVSADDVRFTFQIYSDPNVGSSSGSQLGNIDSVSTPDSHTAVFWFRRRSPLQFFDATNQMQILPRHVFGGMTADSLRKNASAATPVGSGRFRFVSWKRGTSIELAPDTSNYRGRAKLQRVIWSIIPSPIAASTMLLAGDTDIYDAMRPENVREAATNPNLKVVSSDGSDYVFLTFNFRNPKNQDRPHNLFASRDLRRALSIAVDRTSMVRNVFDSLALPGLGPTIRAFPTTDTTIEQLPFDVGRASSLLDSLGWRAGSDGIRERNGRKLQFSILVPGSSLNRQKMAVLLQEQFRRIGASVSLDEVEFGTFSARLQARDFDTALASFHLGASAGAVRETWTSAAAKARGGLNYGWYMNPAFDALVDSATSAMDLPTSRNFYTAAYKIAIEDAPAIWLYEPKMVIGINRRVTTKGMRADAWWSALAEWDAQ